jgi:hypothetical protein
MLETAVYATKSDGAASMPISGIRIALLDLAKKWNFWTISRTHGISPVLCSLAAKSIIDKETLHIEVMGAIRRASFHNWSWIEVVWANCIQEDFRLLGQIIKLDLVQLDY